MSDLLELGEGNSKPGLKDFDLEKKPKKPKLDLTKMSTKELLELRDDIDMRLPPINLREFNLQEATLLHYHMLRELQNAAAMDESIPTNQKAQVSNAISAALKEITKMRNEIYNAEQFRLMEAALARALRDTSPEFQQSFLNLYQKKAEEMAHAGPGAIQ